jgi:hypothetical protein
MSAASTTDPPVPVEGAQEPAPLLTAGEGGLGNTGGATEAEVSKFGF